MRSMGGTNNFTFSPNHLPTWGVIICWQHPSITVPATAGGPYSSASVLVES